MIETIMLEFFEMIYFQTPIMPSVILTKRFGSRV